MSVYKPGRLYWYEFVWRGERIRETTKQGNKNVARQVEAAHKTALAKGEVGIREKAKVPTVAEFSDRFLETVETQCEDRPYTVRFYGGGLRHLLKFDPLASCRLDQADEALIEVFKQHRTAAKSKRGEQFAVGSINGELAILRRMLRMAHEFRIIDGVPKVALLRGAHSRDYVVISKVEKLYLESADNDLRDIR